MVNFRLNARRHLLDQMLVFLCKAAVYFVEHLYGPGNLFTSCRSYRHTQHLSRFEPRERVNVFMGSAPCFEVGSQYCFAKGDDFTHD